MELHVTDCNSVLFVCILVVFGTDTLDSSTVSPCQSRQYAELGEKGVIRCNIQYQYHGFYWYMGNVRLDNNPAIRFEDNRKTGYGYPNEFDCTNDGSLVVKNVTLRHDNVFKILILRSDVEQRNIYEVNLVTTVTPDVEFPMIKHNFKAVSDYVNLNKNDSLVCIVKAARPSSRITWFKSVPQNESVLKSTEEVRLSNKNLSYDSSQSITFWSGEKFVLDTFLCRSVGPGYERISQIVVDFDEDGALLNSSRTKIVTISGNETVSISCVEHVKPTLVVWKKRLQDGTLISLALLSNGKVKKLFKDSSEDFHVELDGTLVIYTLKYQRRQNIYRCLFNDGITTSGKTFQLLSTASIEDLTVTDEHTLRPDVHDTKNVLVVLITVGIAVLIIVVGIIVLLQRRKKVKKLVTKKQQDRTCNRNVEYVSEEDNHELEEKNVSRCESNQDIKECIEKDEEQIPLFSTEIQDKRDNELTEQQEKEKVCGDDEDDRGSCNPNSFQLYAELSDWKGLITYQQFIEVTREENEVSADRSLDNIAFRFLSRVMAYDNQALTVFARRPTLPTSHIVDESDDWVAAFCEAPDSSTENDNEPNVLDLVLTFIIKCDMFLRQKVLERMAACNIAVPVLLPLPGKDELFFLNWGLRSITKFCKDRVSGGMNEEYVLCSRFPTVLFITLGDATESVYSQRDMSNKVLANLQENMQSYFFIGNEQECSRSKDFDGLLECVWLTPIQSAACIDSNSAKTVSFLNLRGNALNHTRQLKYVLPTAHVVIVYLQDSTIKEHCAKINDIRSNGAYVCIVSTRKDAIETSFQNETNLQIFNVQELGEMTLAYKLCCTIKEQVEKDTKLPLLPCLEESFHGLNNHIKSEKDAVVECTNAEKVVRRIIEHAGDENELVISFWEEAFKLETCDYMLSWLELLLHEKYSIESMTRFLVDYFESSAEEERERTATIGARLIMSGRPLELVRGDTCGVPINWIAKVLEQVTRLFETQSARLFVTSAIGIQKSGKSSLLNTLFKTSFPVRSGQCSKGMQFQILKVERSQQEKLECDFIAVLDTEGMQEPDLKPLQGPQREISFTAFTMLISDLVLLNVAGETMENDTANVFVSAAQMVEEITDHKIFTRITHQLISDPKAKHLQTAEVNYLRKRLEKRDNNNGKVTKVTNKVVIDEDSYYFPPFGEDNNSKNKDFCEVGFQLKNSLLNIIEGTMNYNDINGFTKRISVANDRFNKTK